GGQDALEPVAYLRHVPVAWQVDQTGQEAAVVVAPEEQPELATLLQVEYGARDRHEVVERRLEQLVAWVGLEEVDQCLTAVAGGVETEPVQDRLGLVLEDGHPRDALGVRRRGEQAEEPAFSGDVSV